MDGDITMEALRAFFNPEIDEGLIRAACVRQAMKAIEEPITCNVCHRDFDSAAQYAHHQDTFNGACATLY